MPATQTETIDPTYEQLCKALARLSPREEKILRMRLGIGTDRKHTHDEIAYWFCLDQDVVKRIEKKALQKLQHPFVKTQ